jgi:hypothetical protein
MKERREKALYQVIGCQSDRFHPMKTSKQSPLSSAACEPLLKRCIFYAFNWFIGGLFLRVSALGTTIGWGRHPVASDEVKRSCAWTYEYGCGVCLCLCEKRRVQSSRSG